MTGGLEDSAAATSGIGATRHLYVHVPFCARRCSYCDFSIAVRRRLPLESYLRAVGREAAPLRGALRPATLYLGGGTPSKLGGAGIGRLAALLALDSPLEECTLEANPEDVTPANARDWVRAGVTRLSLGAQSFDDGVLRWMHRTHDAVAIGAAVAAARGAGLANVSLDLIFALPDACARDWRRDLEAAIALEPDHVSLYGLTLEPRTPLERQRARGALVPAPEPRYAEEYLEAHERLGVAGYAFYEVSNAARPGREAVHNRAYWTLAPFLGLGPSAHSFDGVARWWNEPAYAAWQRKVDAGEDPVAGREVLTDEQRRLERLYLGLRTREGIGLPEPCPPGTRAAFDRWVAQGWAVLDRGVQPGDSTARLSGPPVSERPSPAALGPRLSPARVNPRALSGVGPRAFEAGADRVRLTPQGWLRLDELVITI